MDSGNTVKALSQKFSTDNRSRKDLNAFHLKRVRELSGNSYSILLAFIVLEDNDIYILGGMQVVHIVKKNRNIRMRYITM